MLIQENTAYRIRCDVNNNTKNTWYNEQNNFWKKKKKTIVEPILEIGQVENRDLMDFSHSVNNVKGMGTTGIDELDSKPSIGVNNLSSLIYTCEASAKTLTCAVWTCCNKQWCSIKHVYSTWQGETQIKNFNTSSLFLNSKK